MEQNNRIQTVDALRGLASLSVAWFHLTNGNPGFLPDGWLKQSGAYGWLGVEVFFVISGFIIPISMYRTGYQLRSFGRFIWKRVVRLDPPYLVNIALVLGTGYISSKLPGYRGHPFEFSPYQTFLHLGYLNTFVGEPWINPVYWTLAIEFQFYLLAGLLFPLLITRDAKRSLCLLGVVTFIAFNMTYQGLIFPFAFHFSMGVVVFRYRAGLVEQRSFGLLLLLLTLLSYFRLGGVMTGVGLLTALIIAFVELRSRALFYLGLISYSLYLIHGPIGGRFINFAMRLQLTLPEKTIVLLVALLVSLGSATVYYLLIEKPAQQWSSAVKLATISAPLTQATIVPATTAQSKGCILRRQ